MAMARANSEGKLCYFDAEGQTPATRPFIVMARRSAIHESNTIKLQTLIGSARKVC
jgi:hypothetical protein